MKCCTLSLSAFSTQLEYLYKKDKRSNHGPLHSPAPHILPETTNIPRRWTLRYALPSWYPQQALTSNNRRVSRFAGDCDLPVSAQRCPQSKQIEGSRLWQSVAENRYGLESPHAVVPNVVQNGKSLTDATDSAVAAVDAMTGVPELVAKAHGTVLELGPGSGTQLPRYDVSKIDRIYGVEPNVDLHDALRSNVKKHGLSDVYTIVPCVIEDFAKLKEYGLEPETVDTVTSMQVLCSVPEPEALAKDLYRLLKPGGQMIVYEHVKSEDFVSHFVQCLLLSDLLV